MQKDQVIKNNATGTIDPADVTALSVGTDETKAVTENFDADDGFQGIVFPQRVPRELTTGLVPGIHFASRGAKSISSHDYPLAVYQPEGEQIRDVIPINLQDQFSSTSTATTIFSSSLSDLRAAATNRDERIDLTPFATAERYRFIDCAKYVQDNSIHIWEMLELPHSHYASISHVWKSLPPEQDSLNSKLNARGVFLVDGEDRNDGGPISIDVLHYVCLASLQVGVNLLWLDRLCVLQTASDKGKRDKRWQIMNMYDIYKGCRICFVLPAGLRRFPIKEEETEWVERAWTFQEVMVAPEIRVLYTDYIGSPPQSAVHSMHIEEYFLAQLRLYDDDRDGSQERRQQFTQALERRDQFRQEQTSVGHLDRFRDVWEYVQWRTSARPVDVVFSVMGLLGLTLDPDHFTRDDRLKATIAIAQALLLKDEDENTCIDIPLWRRVSRSRLDDARKAGITTKEYIIDIPTRVRLQALEQELDSQSLRRFNFATKTSLASGFEALERERAEDEDLEQLKDVKAVVMASGDQPDAEIRAFLARKVNSSTKDRRRADRVLRTIPLEYIRKTVANSSDDNDQRILFRTPDKVVIELCRELCSSASISPHNDISTVPRESIFGWSVGSVLWVRLERYADRSGGSDIFNVDKFKSASVPIITFWKFRVS
ncbi:hypothetical protein K435DRAFT_758030 [Dendrothele bispora CBS 962.96]|uniref:Heterokaryon incompatibility domain-containing protein n=1 Tax=Dendrothele bispora (strain CBS 962.96) TaxID=1314807 RepID=A0A4S8LTT8_DENBC|nr:hypothetical protein K435DRAFT_758030 [Dendrothele bispora CBS 962.96]